MLLPTVASPRGLDDQLPRALVVVKDNKEVDCFRPSSSSNKSEPVTSLNVILNYPTALRSRSSVFAEASFCRFLPSTLSSDAKDRPIKDAIAFDQHVSQWFVSCICLGFISCSSAVPSTQRVPASNYYWSFSHPGNVRMSRRSLYVLPATASSQTSPSDRVVVRTPTGLTLDSCLTNVPGQQGRDYIL